MFEVGDIVTTGHTACLLIREGYARTTLEIMTVIKVNNWEDRFGRKVLTCKRLYGTICNYYAYDKLRVPTPFEIVEYKKKVTQCSK